MRHTPPNNTRIIILGVLLLLFSTTAFASTVTSLQVAETDMLTNPGKPGDKVYFDSATDTLYLTDAAISGAIAANADEMTVSLAGHSSIAATGSTAVNLKANASSTAATLIVTGDGSLDVTGGKYYGLAARDILIKSGTVHITGISLAGILPSNALTIRGGEITIDQFATTYTSAYGVWLRNGPFKMTAGNLTIDNQHTAGMGISAKDIEIKGGVINSFGTIGGMDTTGANGNLTISGGRLTIESSSNVPLGAYGNLLISGGRLDVTTAAPMEPVISARGNIRMTGGRVTAKSKSASTTGVVACFSRKDIVITGGALTATGGDQGASAMCDLEIGGTAAVRAEGATQALSSGAIPYQVRIGGTNYTGADKQVQIVNGTLVTTIEPVTDIANLPTVATTDEPLALTGKIEPNSATGQTILWTIKTDGGVGAFIEDGILTAAKPGTLALTATVPGGKSAAEDYEKDFDLTVMNRAAAPVASPVGGSYTSAQNITLRCQAPNATIRYTTDGSDPTSSSAVYAAPIELTGDKTVKAIAVAPGMTDSRVMTETYAIDIVEPDVLELNVNLLAIQKGKKFKLAGLTGFSGLWESMDTSIAAIKKTGVLTAKKAGNTTLRFTVGVAQKGAAFMGKTLTVGDTVSIALHVVKKGQAVKKLSVTPKQPIIGISERLPLSASVSPRAAAYPQVFWRSRDPKIVTVDVNGSITGVAVGTAEVIATATNGQSQTILVTVSDKLAAMELNFSKKKLKARATLQLSLKSYAPASLPAPGLVWSSSKNSVAAVDENGLVTAVKRGKATIIATSPGGVKAICKITVK